MNKVNRIICRAGTVLLALTVIPNMIFNTLIYIVIDPGLGEKSPMMWGESISIAYACHMLGPGGPLEGIVKAPEGDVSAVLFDLLRPAAWAGILIALAVLLLLAIAVIAAASNKKLPLLILAGLGIVSVAAAFFLFGKFVDAVQAPDFNLVSLLGDGMLTTLLGAFLKPRVDTLQLSKGISMLFVIFGAVLVWVGGFIVTTPRELKK
ncbi:MAG: hypothetical protein LBQ33_05465 [Oscillospiraceae bacterium]|jgi:hypothetical protein|nr:hypothetical protein [Oscillospiraceae bacterium]